MTDHDKNLTIGVVGTGAMGSALAKTLHREGFGVIAWNRTRERTAPLASLGIDIAMTAAALVERADIIVCNLRDYGATEGVVGAQDVARKLQGKTLVELASGTPDEARASHARFAALGCDYLDGAIIATPDLIGTQDAALILSGDDEPWQKARAALESLAPSLYLGAEVGKANGLDTAVLCNLWGALFAGAQAIAICQAEGIDLDVMAGIWGGSSAGLQGMVADMISRTAAGRFDADEHTLSTVATHYSAFSKLERVVKARALDDTLVSGYRTLFEKAARAGVLESDFSVMTTLVSRHRA